MADALERFPKLRAVVDSAAPEVREDVRARLLGPSPTAEIVAAVLSQHGHPVSASSIRTYRRLAATEGRAS